MGVQYIDDDEPVEKIRTIMDRERTLVSARPATIVCASRIEHTRTVDVIGIHVGVGSPPKVEAAHIAEARVPARAV